MRNLLLLVSIFLTIPLYGQPKTIKTDIFTVMYSEEYEQPLMVTYMVLCPNGDASRNGLDFRKYDGVHTSDNDDYKNNPYDKGHMAPAADFNCDREMVRSTFSYLNCALQHEGLNRGPWKELERFERDLAKLYPNVEVYIKVHFDSDKKVSGGATIPTGFTKIITFECGEYSFYFPNEDVAGIDWSNFKTN